MPAQFRKLGHDRFLPHWCEFTVHHSTVQTILNRYQATRWTTPCNRGQISSGRKTLFSSPLSRHVWGPPRLILNGYRGLFLREVKLYGARSWPFILSTSTIQNMWNYTSTPPYALMAWHSITCSNNFIYHHHHHHHVPEGLGMFPVPWSSR